MAKKKIVIEEPDQDPTVNSLSEQPEKVPKKDLKKYLFLVHPKTYADLSALVAVRNLERVRNGSRAYTLNQLLTALVNEYLDRDEIKDELDKAREILGE